MNGHYASDIVRVVERTTSPTWLTSILSLVLLIAWAPPLFTQDNGAREPRAQFVFVIDDSGSMGRDSRGNESWGKAADQDRLAVFAVRALLGVLDDRDSVSVIRLNGALEDEEPPPLAPLSGEHRERILHTLDLGGKLAEYSGGYTPCRSALEAVHDLLDKADRADVSQVVIFLSDGRCTGKSEHQEPTLDWLENVRSHQDGSRRFQFYLLRFQDTKLSAGLRQMAEASGGAAIEVRRGDPTRILNTFAQALSRSQGYESEILTPSRPGLPPHRGARRVRLLAVVRGGGSDPLQISVTDRQGNPLAVNSLDGGTHQFLPDGQEYRFASADYRPSGEPVRIDVRGAGGGWEVVALPEYRLAVEMALHHGRCDEEGDVLSGDIIAAGSGLCAVLRLVNDRNQVVGQDVTAGQLEGVIELISPDLAGPRRIKATPKSATAASFQLDLQGLAEGHHTLRPAVELTPPGDNQARILPAAPRTLQAVDRAINPEPARIDFGDIYPGFHDTRPLKLTGSFPETEAYLEVADPGEISTCVTLQFADKPLGESVRARPNQSYPLHLRVAEECSDERVDQAKTQLLFRMPEIPEADKVSIPLAWRLDSTVLVSSPLELNLKAGTSTVRTVSESSSAASVRYEASLAQPTAHKDGSRVKHLHVGFSDQLGEPQMIVDAEGKPIRDRQVVLGANQLLTLWIEARPCCHTGNYKSQLRLRPTDGGQARIVPLKVAVQGNWWTCYSSWVIAGLLGVLAAFLTFYFLSMFAHSNLLTRRQLVARLIPLHWPRYGGAPQPASDRSGDREEVEDMIRAGMPWHQRLLNWLRANPLVFGLPGRRYYETVELLLAPDLNVSSVMLIPERDVVDRLQKSQEMDPWEEGRLFARAGSAISFQAIRGPKKEIGQLTPDGWYGKIDGLRVEPLSKGQRLIHKIPAQDRKEGFVAGWVLE